MGQQAEKPKPNLMKTKNQILATFLLILSLHAYAQVGNVRSNVSNDKKSSRSSSSSSYSSGEGSESSGFFEALIVDFFAAAIVESQIETMSNREIYPQRLSFEVPVSYGTDFSYGSGRFETGARFNWGIFATDFKYSHLHDPSGKLNTIEWIVLDFKIPIQNFQLDYGIGVTSVIDEDQDYFKNTFGFDLRLPKKGIFITSAYQWTEKSSMGTRFKKNFNFRVDYEIYNRGKLHLSPALEYSYQNYFDEDTFHFVSLGMIMRIF